MVDQGTLMVDQGTLMVDQGTLPHFSKGYAMDSYERFPRLNMPIYH